MYAKLFSSIYQGTLRGDTLGLVVFTNLLAHADAEGWVDIHPKAIADETGLTMDQVLATLLVLESPDPESRSPEEDGRRIKRLDEHRAWGWTIVNHAKYRVIRSQEDRREQNRLAQERWRKRNAYNNKSKQPSAESAKAEVEAEALTTKDIRPSSFPDLQKDADQGVHSANGKHPPPAPIAEIIGLYNAILPMCQRCRVRNVTRDSHIKARWQQIFTDGKATDRADGLQAFREFFEYASKSKFLTGQAKPTGDRRPFKADLDWLMKPTNFANVIEGKYA